MHRIEENKYKDDRDGTSYSYLVASGKKWLTENFHFDIGEGCWPYTKPRYTKKYGRLYTLEAAKKACPQGWRLASWEDLDNLDVDAYEMYPEMNEYKDFYYKLNFQPGGYRDNRGKIIKIGERGYYWTASVDQNNRPIIFGMKGELYRFYSSDKIKDWHTDIGFSCRYIQDID